MAVMYHSRDPSTAGHASRLKKVGSSAGTEKRAEVEIVPRKPIDDESSTMRFPSMTMRGADVLLPLAMSGEPLHAPLKVNFGIESFQEALRMFPSYRDEEGTTPAVPDVNCPDCDAIFSSTDELKDHFLTKLCPGAAITVYTMTRDRLITKGYRIEKKLVPLNSRPLRFYCQNCDRIFTVDDHLKLRSHKNMPYCVDCTLCNSRCNVVHEPALTDWSDTASFRDLYWDIAGGLHKKSPSIAQSLLSGTRHPPLTSSGENPLFQSPVGKRARRLRDSLSFRKFSQSDEDELIAISFTSYSDLERVHAPHGVLHSVHENPSSSPTDISGSMAKLNSHREPIRSSGSEKSTTTLCEDEVDRLGDGLTELERGLVLNGTILEEPQVSRRRSLMSTMLGQKIFKGLSRASSASSRSSKKLVKRVNTARFSLVLKRSSHDCDSVVHGSGYLEQDVYGRASVRDSGTTAAPDVQYIDLLRSSQNVYVHLQKASSGALAHDAAGRQRVLTMTQVAHAFLHVKEEFSAAIVASRAGASRLRAENAMKQGNLREAVALFQEALGLLNNRPALDVDQISHAEILHKLGQLHQELDMPADAEGYYLDALGLYRRSFGRDHQRNFAVLHDLGSLCEKDGYATEAAALYERCYAGRLRTIGQHAPDTLSSMQDLAAIKVSLGDLESALFLLEKAVFALETVFGAQDERTLTAMSKLSIVYEKLGLEKESRIISGKMIPHCKTLFGINSPLTRDTVVRFLHNSENFDFTTDVRAILDQYQRSRGTDGLRVIHRLGRCYMDAGLNRDAVVLFEDLVEEFLALKGAMAPETFDALSALCVSREHLDCTEKAVSAYDQLVQLAQQTPEGHHSRKRIPYAQKRIVELKRRRDVLAAERKAWGLTERASCEVCGTLTANVCTTCDLYRFCSETCLELGRPSHQPRCIPSVTLRQSKSLALKPRCPAWAQEQAISLIKSANGNNSNKNRSVKIVSSYTYYLDPRNLATVRMQVSSQVNTAVLFSAESDIRYTVLYESRRDQLGVDDQEETAPLNEESPSTILDLTATAGDDASDPEVLQLRRKEEEPIDWLTPQMKKFVCFPATSESSASSSTSTSTSAPAKYLLVTPGKGMLKSIVDRRVSVRGGGGEKEYFEQLSVPDERLNEYVQGLLLTGYMGEAFMYVLEWTHR